MNNENNEKSRKKCLRHQEILKIYCILISITKGIKKVRQKRNTDFTNVDIMRTKIVWSLCDGGPLTGVSYLNEVIDVKTIVKLTPVIFGPGILMIK